MSISPADRLLIEQIRSGAEDAWAELIARFEGRLLAFVESRIGARGAAEDLVQETFVGFLTSLPNYDQSRPLESYLFSIAAHKLTDHLRRQGRRPAIHLGALQAEQSSWDAPAAGRAVSSAARSQERRGWETTALTTALAQQLAHWRQRGDWDKLKVCELLFVRGLANKEAAAVLRLSEQTVANYKFELLAKLKQAVRAQDLPEADFPELAD